ncbi:E1 protein [Erethizon dorsatum papillomavirus 2]|uniref:Replication protein E1 n=1 Tax=Erethizon dorsatum papillomavirus 2 TaxID=2268125 RepID=A0A2Z5ENB4_9PAPI|nr:E1 protein [Erethizon dorsatum papillomavirus 2]AXB87778.1 E1 protein [Erethizon dorsatum papillomavirus 2]
MDKGTDMSREEGGDWFIVHEADCTDDETLESLFDDDTQESFVSDLLEEDQVDQGNSLELFNGQMLEDDIREVQQLKRKYLGSPESVVEKLSPRLAAVSISPNNSQKSKRRLFDSGIGKDAETPQEVPNDIGHAETTSPEVEVECLTDNANNSNVLYLDLLKSSNRYATALCKFRDCFDVSFTDLTRNFKSDKTCGQSWVVAAFGCNLQLVESSKTLLQSHCEYIQVQTNWNQGLIAFYLLQFKASKNRETVLKQFTTLLNAQEIQLMAQPPKHRSVAVCLYFWKKGISSITYTYGELPEWIAKQTMVSHQLANAETFELSKMVQWAYDNNYLDESEIAYYYAQYADEDANAAAWLRHNNQAKFVKDCAVMARLYKRQEQRECSISQWITKCCTETKGEEESWHVIGQFLKYQQVNMVVFLTQLRKMLQGTPKKHVLVVHGPPDTGKSYFCSSLVRFMQGKVVSFMNAKSHFWLQPLVDAKLGFLDDATHQTWRFFDSYMRNALDGNYISVDLKHKAPLQLKLPPMLITTNVDVQHDESYFYLHSRLMFMHFPNKMPLDAYGEPKIQLTNNVWKCFFGRLRKQLGLEDEEDADSGGALQLTARTTTEFV